MTGVFCFAVVGLPDGDVHHVQGPHWEECVPCGLGGHEHGPEQVSAPPLARAPQHPRDITLGEAGGGESFSLTKMN